MEPTLRLLPEREGQPLFRLVPGIIIIPLLLIFLAFITSNDLKAQISFDVDIVRSTCPGQFLGAIEIINVSGGTPPYSYSIDNGMNYQASATFSGLDVGPYLVRVIDDNQVVSDAVEISPDTEPTAVCQSVTVALQNDGKAVVQAETFDKMSTDNCDLLWFKVRRMTASMTCPTENNPANLFFDSLTVCCDDIPLDTVIVELRVYDRDPGPGPIGLNELLDRSALCMTSVKVEDNLGPELIQCPDHLTVDCREDLTDLSRFGNPVVRDNCALIDSVYEEIPDLNQCREGEIVRNWTYTDQSGGTVSCTQVITVENYVPFDGLDTNQLHWPADFTVFGCNTVDTHPDSTGFPEINEDECSQVAFYWDDDVYQFAPDACVKIRRHWTVLDWCQYDRSQPRSPENGVWTYTQEIKILDTLAPVLNGPTDTLVFSFTEDCGSVFVELPLLTAEDCADSADLEYRIEVDIDFDDEVERFIEGNDASDMYPIGEHLITFIVDDKCNNVSKWETILAVQDGKAPNAVLINRLIVPLIEMGTGGMASVRASQFNLKSYDNCTDENNLRFSFSEDVNDTIRVYNCDSLGSRLVTVYVTDEAGNQGFAVNYVEIQDNDGICPATVTSQLGGQITNISGQPLENISLELTGGTLHQLVKTDSEGLYAFSTIGSGQSVNIQPESPTNWMTGVSTRDIILIQQYLLGIHNFDMPEKYIAADVDGSGHISTRDIISLRKLILGVSEDVSGNSSWRFVDKGYTFVNPDDPLKESFPEKCAFVSTAGIQATSFTAIKVGDVTGDALLGSEKLISRSSDNSIWRWNWSNSAVAGQNIYTATSSSSLLVHGFQIEIHSRALRPGLVYGIKASSKIDNEKLFWRFTESGIRVQFAGITPVAIEAGDMILEIQLSDQRLDADFHENSSAFFRSEYYDGELMASDILFEAGNSSKWNASIAPNPSEGSTILTIEDLHSESCRVDLYGINGFKINTIPLIPDPSGTTQTALEVPSQYPEGIYLIRIVDEQQQVRVLKWHYRQ